MIYGKDALSLRKITREIAKGYKECRGMRPGVVFFGSARIHEKDRYYHLAYNLSHYLAQHKIMILTGAGPGIMEAANRGAFDAGGKSVGFNIDLPVFQKPNPYINKYVEFKHFYVRKVMFAKYSFITIVFPGGYGTLDEIFDQLAILQNHKIKHRPFIIVGDKYYKGLKDWLTKKVLGERKIDQKDIDLITFTEDIDEISRIVKRTAYKNERKKL